MASNLNSSEDESPYDKDIWNSLKAGDQKALSYIYSLYFRPLYNYGMRISKDACLVEDCIQDLFVEFWNKRATLSDVWNIKPYLYKSLRRRIIYVLTCEERVKEKNELLSFEMELQDKTHYLNQQIKSDIRERLKKLITTLSPKQKEVIFLLYFHDLTYEEIAAVMDLKLKTVYNLVHLAMSNLKGKKDSLSLQSLALFFTI